MRKISAHYIFTGDGTVLKRGVLTATDDGTIVSVAPHTDHPAETSSTEFYNGVLVPGFINCHCHLELSHLKGTIPQTTGLGGFIKAVNETRQAEESTVVLSALSADREMYDEGIVACGDISNTSSSFEVKRESRIEYITFLEIFGAVADRSDKRMEEALNLRGKAEERGIHTYLTPHSVYSVSSILMEKIIKHAGRNPLFSVHFLESPDERLLTKHRTGPMTESYRALGIPPETMGVPYDHLDTAVEIARRSKRVMLVHNTFVNDDEIKILVSKGNVSWCLCPSSNKYITGATPPLSAIERAGGLIVTGTDSLASNNRLSILAELYLLQEESSGVTLEKMIKWATFNGAITLDIEKTKGSFSTGKKPGVLLIEEMDLINMKLLPGSRVRRLL